MTAYKDKGRWRYRFQHNDKRHSGSTAKGHNTKAAAEKLERVHLEKLERHEYTGDMPTVAVFSVRFLEHQKAHTAQLTQEGQKRHFDLHINPALGKYKLDAVSKMLVDQLKIAWRKKAAASTINTRLDTLQRMLALAHEWGYLLGAPKIKRLPKDHDEEELRFLADQEHALLVECAKPQWRSMILIGLRTGLRIGELRGLQWTDVNFETRSIRVARTDPGRKGMDANSPKSGKGRSVPMTADAFQCMSELAENRSRSKYVWPAFAWRGKKRDGARSESGCKHGIEAAAKKAGLTDIGWHTLRHTYASALVMRAVPLKFVQELLGHASIRQTEVYAHLAPGFAHHAAVQALDAPLMVVERPALASGAE